jgi:hypothetical protein
MAYNFAGSSTQYLEVGSAPASSVPLTMACRFFASSPSTLASLMALNRPDNPSRFQLILNASNVVAGVVDASGTGGADSTAGTVASNTWSHAAGVFTSNTSRTAYLDGAAGGANTANIVPSGLNRLYVGTLRGSVGLAIFFTGLIAEAGIWNAALTAAEIASLAKGMTPDKIRPQSLVFYAPLVRDLIDVRGGLTITNNNSATVADHPRVYA